MAHSWEWHLHPHMQSDYEALEALPRIGTFLKSYASRKFHENPSKTFLELSC